MVIPQIFWEAYSSGPELLQTGDSEFDLGRVTLTGPAGAMTIQLSC